MVATPSRQHVPAADNDAGIAAARGGGGAAWRLRVSLKAGPGAAARPEAGNCEEGFACLFQVCAVLSHQACTGGSVFSDASCPRRVCRDSYSIFGLFWTLSHVLTYTAQYWVIFINMFHTVHPICGMERCNGALFATVAAELVGRRL